MQSDTTFTTTLIATTMDTRETILAELGGMSLEDLHKILAAVRLGNTVEAADGNNTSDHKDDNPEATPNDPEAPQNNPVTTKTQDHAGIITRAYPHNTLAAAHANL